MRRLLLLLVAVALGAAGATWLDDDAPAGGGAFRATVVRVVDGDTVVVRRANAEVTVRLVQIDAPESSGTRFGRPDACGAAASAFAHRLAAPGDRVTVQPTGAEATDRYGRTLALIRFKGGRSGTWQEAMVRAGWAEPLVVNGNETALLGRLRRLAAEARTARRGVWARCDGAFHDGG